MKPHALTMADVERLTSARAADARIDTMRKLVRDLDSGDLEEGERSLALEVLHCFAADAEAAVREAVAWQIHNSPLLTTDLAQRMARDVDRVAFPVLRHAERLSDSFLLAVLADGGPGRQLAVAGRRTVSAAVADRLVEVGGVAVMTCLMRNPGADIREGSLHRALDRFGRIRAVGDAVALRPGLSLAVVERLIGYVSDGIRDALVSRHGLAPDLVARLIERGREAATLRLLRPVARTGAEVELLTGWLHARNHLSPAFLFRALCAGDLELFTAGLGVLAGITTDNARRLAWDDGSLGLRALFRQAGLPPVLLDPFRVALSVAKTMPYAGEEERRDAFQAQVIARVFAECVPTSDWAVDDLLIQLFDQKSDEVIDHAMAQAGLPFAPVW